MQRRRILKTNRTEEQRAMDLGEKRAGMTSTTQQEARRRAERQAARNNVKSSSTHPSALNAVFPGSSFSPVLGMRVCGLAA